MTLVSDLDSVQSHPEFNPAVRISEDPEPTQNTAQSAASSSSAAAAAAAHPNRDTDSAFDCSGLALFEQQAMEEKPAKCEC